MEDPIESLTRRELTLNFMMVNRKFSKRCFHVSLLRDRMKKWCEDILDDLTLIDAEDLDHSKYRYNVHQMNQLIGECWHKMEFSLTGVYKDVGWLHEKLDNFEQDFVDLWWFMAEDVNKRVKRIEDLISSFYVLHAIFKEMLELYVEIFKELHLAIFEKYRHY